MVSAALMQAEAIVIGGSAGSVAVLAELLPRLPADGPPVLVVVHVPPSPPSRLVEIFAPRCQLRVREADASCSIERGTLYFAPPDYHLLVEERGRCALSLEPPVHFSRPSIDVLFESAAHVFGPRLVGVILTGASADGAAGLAAIHARGGTALVQSPELAEAPVMPRAALAAVPTARVLHVADLASALGAYGAPP
jgi:two-component system, chemotaxis family, protein-glutamate methylesterase/glutaminase